MRALEPHQLELLLEFQGFRCALTDRPLLVPDADDLITASYNCWLMELSPVNYNRAAVLTRLNSAEPWERGNILFICAPWAALHESCGDLAEVVLQVRQVAARLSDGLVPCLAADKYYQVAASG